MTENIKNIVGIFIIIALAAVAYSVISYSGSFSRQVDASAPRFSVSGTGKVVVIPNIGTFNFGVLTEGGKDVTSLQNENTKKMNSIISYLKSQGIVAKDIKTTGYSIQPRYQYNNCSRLVVLNSVSKTCPPREIVGYTISQNVTVKVRDFKKAGSILAEVGKKGANSVSQLSFSIDDKTIFENEARAKAIVQAKEKAQAIASEAGFGLGRLLSVNESKSNYYPRPLFLGRENKSIESTATPVNIEPGSQDVTISVTLQYQIN